MSADGQKMAAGAVYSDAVPGNYSPVYLSTNGGNTWFTSSTPVILFNHVAASSDFTKLAAVAVSRIYVSEDSGQSWTESVSPLSYYTKPVWTSEGKLIVAINDNGLIYTMERQPRLELLGSDSNSLCLKWPAYGPVLRSYTNRVMLDQTFALDPPDWVQVTNAPVQTNLYNYLVLPRTNASGLFRLRLY
jgi:hypothetical protein